jgi:hypothetical protein
VIWKVHFDARGQPVAHLIGGEPRIPPHALAAQDWSQIVATAESS